MGKNLDIDMFMLMNEDSSKIEYFNRVYENLKDLNEKEEKFNLWAIVIVFLYLILASSKIESFDIGPVTINDITIISKILPVVFAYVLFNQQTITSHKKDVTYTIKTLSEKLFKQIPTAGLEKELGNNFLTRIFLPYSFTNSISKVIPRNANIVESVIGFTLLIPLFLVALVPYIIIVLMLIDLYINSMNDNLGKLCFALTIWMFLLMLFYIVKNAISSMAEND